jgi:hypothetical protein
MNREPQSHPMAPADCTLGDEHLAEQLARYPQLSTSGAGGQPYRGAVRVRFERAVDRELLEQTLTIERGCCSFFTLDYDAFKRVMSIATEPDSTGALSTLIAVLMPSRSDR